MIIGLLVDFHDILQFLQINAGYCLKTDHYCFFLHISFLHPLIGICEAYVTQTASLNKL
jgi:hypothetical protein